MELKVTGTNIELFDRVQEYVERKLAKLNRHWPNIIEIKIEITEEQTKSKENRILVHATVDADGTILHGEERAKDQYTAIDNVSETMIRQLEHFKGKLYDRSRSTVIKEQIGQEEPEVKPARKVVKVKNFFIKPMSLQEAIAQMEALGHDFFLFVNADNNELKLIYLRKDGNYGLIEPRLKP